MNLRALALLFVLGCGGHFRAPDTIKGDVPLVVANNTDEQLCKFWMVPTTQQGNGDNWVHIPVVQGHESNTVKVQPGRYRINVEGCAGYRGWIKELAVKAPTYLAIDRPGTPPAGYGVSLLSVKFAPRRPQGPQCQGAEGHIHTNDSLSECCSGRAIDTHDGWMTCQ